MDIIVIFIFVIIDICLLKMHKKIYNTSFLFVSFWAVILFWGHFKLVGEDNSSNYTYFIIALGVIFFTIGSLLAKNKKKLKLKINYICKINHFKNQINYTLVKKHEKHTSFYLKIIFGFAIIYSTYNLLNALPLLKNGYSISQIRRLHLVMGESSTINSNALSYFIQNTVYQTCQNICIVVGCAEFLVNKQKKYFFAMLYLLSVSGLIYGSRIVLVDTMLYIFFGAIIISQNKNTTFKMRLTSKQKIMIGSGIFLAICSLVYITGVRQGKGNFWLALYNDYTCSIRLLDICIKQVHQSKDITWGINSIKGIIEPFISILSSRYFGRIIPIPNGFITMSKYGNDFIDIGSGHLNNAYVSTFFYFYLDGRLVGVILFSMICGFLSTLYYNRIASKEYKMVDLCFYFLIISMIFRSMIIFQLASPNYFWAFVLLSLVYKKDNISLQQKTEDTYVIYNYSCTQSL